MLRRISEGVLARAAERPQAPALADPHGSLTYADLAAAIREAARGLRDLGLRAGDRVLILGENSIALAVLILAAAEIDAWTVLENARRAPLEVDAILKHAQPRRVIYCGAGSPEALAHARRHGAQPLALGSWRDLHVGVLDESSSPEPQGEDDPGRVAAMIYTTGTTGTPKGVMLTHGNLLFIASMMRELRRLTPRDSVYGVLPITHVMGLASVLLGTLHAGARLALVPRFSAEHCLRSVRRDGITLLQGAPAMFARLIEHIGARGEVPAPRLRFIAAGGAPVDVALKQAVEARFGLTLHNGYGLTEAASTCWTRLDRPRRDHAVGPPLPGVEVEVRDADGNALESGGVGELWVRGPNVMKGYFRNPVLTAAALTPEGWFNTGDVGRIDRTGTAFVEGRTKEIIIRSGFNVYPLEVEAALNVHPDVAQSAVVGRKVAGNEEVIAFVEPKGDRPLDEAEVCAFLAERLSPYKIPSRLVFLSNLPLAPNGKVIKTELRAWSDGTSTPWKPELRSGARDAATPVNPAHRPACGQVGAVREREAP